MISSKRISLALAALVLVVLAGAGSAYAQTTPLFDVTTAVPFVANTGRSEVLAGRKPIEDSRARAAACHELYPRSRAIVVSRHGRPDGGSLLGFAACPMAASPTATERTPGRLVGR